MKSIKILFALAVFASFAFSPNHEPRKIRVLIDASHGGNDFGATHEQFTEKQITAQIAEKIRASHTNENIELQFTRITDESLSLTDRVALVNSLKPDLVVSLHVNSNLNRAVSGFEIYTSRTDQSNNVKSTVFAKRLADKLSKNLPIENRGIKEAPFMLLNKVTSPAVIVELGFLSNENDRAILTDQRSQDRIAHAILDFIAEME